MLVVEDETLVAMLLTEMLHLGCEIAATVSSVAEAMTAAAETISGVILSGNLRGDNSGRG